MLAKILAVDPEKRERILSAARKEFAAKGYDKASTNEMVREAGISKGLLFHYFESKKDLFIYVYENTYEILRKEFFEKINLDEKDILVRLRQVLSVKLEMLLKYPETIDFITKTYYENSEVTPFLEKKTKEILEQNYAAIFNNIDKSKFLDDVDPQRSIDIILWSVEGYSLREQNKIKRTPGLKPDYEAMFAELDKYLDILQKRFYK